MAAAVSSTVTSTVRERTGELLKTVQETNWTAELATFSEGVKEDTVNVTKKTVAAVEHLPETVRNECSYQTSADAYHESGMHASSALGATDFLCMTLSSCCCGLTAAAVGGARRVIGGSWQVAARRDQRPLRTGTNPC
jgi:hypothetical protein